MKDEALIPVVRLTDCIYNHQPIAPTIRKPACFCSRYMIRHAKMPAYTLQFAENVQTNLMHLVNNFCATWKHIASG